MYFYKKLMTLLFSLLLVTVAVAQKKNKEQTEKKEDKISLSGINFREVGPALTSGRISDFAVNPENRAEYYVAVSSGGVWKTTNAGTSYAPIFDSQGSYSIGCITMDPNNYQTIWVGTGENNNQRSVAYGDGIYKSLNGGKSWENMGLKNSEHIGKIIVHPDNSDVVYVAAIGPLWSAGGERGVYKTSDGGKTWDAVLSIDEHTGVNDIVMDPRNPDILYAAAFQRRRHVFTYISGGPQSGMYKTTDGGENWQEINDGLPNVELGRIGLAISPANPDKIYAIVEAAKDKGGFFVSTNHGENWQKMSNFSTSGNYYQEIVAHPTNEHVVFAMDTWMHWTEDGGKTFKPLGERYKHVDNHAMWIDPDHPNYFLVGCDGGIYESFDAGKEWHYKPNLPVTQFYKVEVDNAEPFYNIYGGTQDNFSLGGPSRTRNNTGIVNSDWFVTNGGDGFESQIDPLNPDIIYAQSQYGFLVRYDKVSGEITGIQPKPGKDEPEYRWNWDAPLQVSTHLPTRIYFSANKLFKSDDRGNTWQTISPDLTRQLNRNELPEMGKVGSIDAVAKNASTSPYGTIVAFSESPLDEQLLYVGTDDGLVQITNNGGENWAKVENVSGVPSMTYVNMLLASQHDENVVYAAFNNHKRGDFKPYLFKSNDKGKTWTSITGNLPERGSTYAIAEDHEDPDLLFAGTEFGVFFSNDGGNEWTQLKGGLPTIAVRDLAIQKRENDLVLGTFGRGFWVLDDYSPLRGLKDENLSKEAYIFPVKKAWMFIEKSPLGNRGKKSFQGESFYYAENPPVGAVFTWHLKDEIKTKKDVREEREKELNKDDKDVPYPTYQELVEETLEEEPFLLFLVKNEDGEVVRQIKTSAKKGVNRTVWDFRKPAKNAVSLQKPDPDNPYAYEPAGPYVLPGKYTVSMAKSVKGEMTLLVEDVPFEVEMLPGTTLPANDWDAMVTFKADAEALNGKVDAAGKTISEIDDKLKYIRKAIFMVGDESGNLYEQVQQIDEKLYELKKELYGDRIAVQLDMDAPYSLSSRVGYLLYEMSRTNSDPTTSQKQAYEIAVEQFADVKAELDALIDNQVQPLEKRLEQMNAPFTPGRMMND